MNGPYSQIVYEVQGPAAVVTLNRPNKGNAISMRLGVELKHALERAENDKEIVGIVITGAGPVFCAGADVEELQKIGRSGDVSFSDPNAGRSTEDLNADPGRLEVPEGFRKGAYSYFNSVSKPVIAAINGAVAGAAMSIILSCDMRFFAQSGFMMSAFSKRGLTAELGISWMLQRIVGIDTALDILWSSRKVDADEAKALKLATRVYPDEDVVREAVAYIENLAAGCSPASIAAMKGQVYRDIFRDPTESFIESHRMQKEALKTADFVEGINAFMEKRKPNFAGIGK
jgi:enoyl-CoA hydratase/carnithine racemase